MGGKVCCTSNFNDEQPLTYKSDGYKKENIRFHIKESQQNELQDSFKKRGLLARNKQDGSKLTDIFQYNLDAPVLFISFSQRKFLGFRNRFEFDRKRVLIASKSSFSIISYDMNDQPHELMNMAMDEEEEIQLITFLDDENPANILLMTYDYSPQRTISRILKVKHETQQEDPKKALKKDF